MRISDWSSDVCSSDLLRHARGGERQTGKQQCKSEKYGHWGSIGQVWIMRFADSAQHTYCRIEAGQGERKHAFVHQCPDQASGLAVIPGALWCGVDPHHLGKAINQSLNPDTARFLVDMLDTAARMGDLIRRHRVIADDPHPIIDATGTP